MKIKSIWLALLVFYAIGCNNTRSQYGENLYKTYCQNCHMEKGDGLQGIIPPVANSDYLSNHYKDLPCIIKQGLKDTIVVNGVTYNNPMEGVSQLSELQIANLVNFIREKWYPKMKIVTPSSVRNSLSECQ